MNLYTQVMYGLCTTCKYVIGRGWWPKHLFCTCTCQVVLVRFRTYSTNFLSDKGHSCGARPWREISTKGRPRKPPQPLSLSLGAQTQTRMSWYTVSRNAALEIRRPRRRPRRGTFTTRGGVASPRSLATATVGALAQHRPQGIAVGGSHLRRRYISLLANAFHPATCVRSGRAVRNTMPGPRSCCGIAAARECHICHAGP